MSPGEAALEWSFDQMRRENPPSSETIARWFAPATRETSGVEVPVWLTSGNHCAVAASASAFETCGTISCSRIPHGYRVAAKELMEDAKGRGAWLPVEDVLAGAALPNAGDLAIYHRGDPTAATGHVNRVAEVLPDGYVAIGANQGPGGSWTVVNVPYTNPNLIGFVVYPDSAITSGVAICLGLAIGAAGLGLAYWLGDL